MRTGSFDQPTSLLSIRDARHPTSTSQSKQRLDGYARVAFEVKPPSSSLLRSARRLQAYDCNLQVTAS
jgi:hypothetical protein